MTTESLDLPQDDHNRKPPRCDSGRPLTPEQEQFARVLGHILAQLWQEEQLAKTSAKTNPRRSKRPS